MANYSEGLEFAYSALEDFEGLRAPEDESGANCHKLIMIFSDGGTEYPQEIISVYTNETRTITRQVNILNISTGFIFGRFSAIKTKSTWQNLEFLGKKLEFFEEFA